MATYDELREQALRMHKQGMSERDIRRELHVSYRRLAAWIHAYKHDQLKAVNDSRLTPAPYRRGYRWGAGI